MPGAAQRAEVCRIGPRALTFLVQPAPPPLVLHNCKRKLSAAEEAFVLGEDGNVASIALLVTGWYRFQATNILPLWVQQLNPQEVIAGVDPAAGGIRLEEGDVATFYVDEDRRDGVILVHQCDTVQAPVVCNGAEVPLATVNRLDTIRKMEATGNTLSVQVLRGRKAPAGEC